MVKPILFNTEMVKAILEGRKTVTRRLIKPQPKTDSTVTLFSTFDYADISYDGALKLSPYQPGDILYVRETWRCWRAHRYEATADIEYKAGGDGIRLYFSNGSTDNPNRDDYDSFIGKWWTGGHGWKPSIHMPKEAARIFLRVTNVSVAKLQDMTNADVEAEGMDLDKWYEYDEWQHSVGDGLAADGFPAKFETMRGSFGHAVWDSTLKSLADYEKYQWDNNPWVWVIEFERTEKPNEWI